MTAHKPTAVEALTSLVRWAERVDGFDKTEWSDVYAAIATQPDESAHPTDGWVTVPCEPTTRQAAIIARGVTAGKGDFASCAQTYRDVISAAPGPLPLPEGHAP